MKILGFWKGFRREDMPSIFDENLIQRTSKVDERIINYLKKGIWLTRLRTIISCPITDEGIGSPATYTDGEWIWTTEYIFYLEKYDLLISKDFYRHLLKKDFIIPDENTLSEELLINLMDSATEYTSQSSRNFK